MNQYKHQEFKFEPKNEVDRIAVLEEQIKNLTAEVQQLKQMNAFLLRQDQRNRSSFDQISRRSSK